jgi:hypothetical protein
LCQFVPFCHRTAQAKSKLITAQGSILASIKEILGDAVDEPVLDAWGSDSDFEAGLYKKAESTPRWLDRMAQIQRRSQSARKRRNYLLQFHSER